MRLIISITFAALLLGGCGSEGSHETLEREKQQAAQNVAAEAQRREHAEAQFREQEARTSRWQFATVLAVSVSALALIIGAILGSSARHDAEK